MHCRYSHIHFVDLEAMKSAAYPMDIMQFEALVAQQCQTTRMILQKQLSSLSWFYTAVQHFIFSHTPPIPTPIPLPPPLPTHPTLKVGGGLWAGISGPQGQLGSPDPNRAAPEACSGRALLQLRLLADGSPAERGHGGFPGKLPILFITVQSMFRL